MSFEKLFSPLFFSVFEKSFETNISKLNKNVDFSKLTVIGVLLDSECFVQNVVQQSISADHTIIPKTSQWLVLHG